MIDNPFFNYKGSIDNNDLRTLNKCITLLNEVQDNDYTEYSIRNGVLEGEISPDTMLLELDSDNYKEKELCNLIIEAGSLIREADSIIQQASESIATEIADIAMNRHETWLNSQNALIVDCGQNENTLHETWDEYLYYIPKSEKFFTLTYGGWECYQDVFDDEDHGSALFEVDKEDALSRIGTFTEEDFRRIGDDNFSEWFSLWLSKH